MARTRTQDYGINDPKSSTGSRRGATSPAAKGKKASSNQEHGAQKRSHAPEASKGEENTGADENDAEAPQSKKAKHSGKASTTQAKGTEKEPKATAGVDSKRLQDIIAKYGTLPLADIGLSKPTEATPETILAFVLNAMLTSARISHELAYRSVKCLIDAGYHDVHTLKKSSWEERTEILTKRGYTRYREKTATALGELADFVLDEYASVPTLASVSNAIVGFPADRTTAEGDLNNIIKRADSSPSKVREMIKGIKGIGNVGTDIFFDTVQGVWPEIAPFIDPRSLKTAEQCGIGGDVDCLWQAIGRDPTVMCKLSSALTTIRLEKKESEFQ